MVNTLVHRLRESLGGSPELYAQLALVPVILLGMGAFAFLFFTTLPKMESETIASPAMLESQSTCVKAKLRTLTDAGQPVSGEALDTAKKECLVADQAQALGR